MRSRSIACSANRCVSSAWPVTEAVRCLAAAPPRGTPSTPTTTPSAAIDVTTIPMT
ncbi:MAG TPA: hypothetical protein VGG05_17560 [Pseudonocardiaceae bacterium]